jgi:hypothetical protein
MTSMSAAQMIALAREGMADGLTEAAEYVQAASRRITPDDPTTGGDDLSGSQKVEPATPDDLNAQVYTDAEWALYQHENLTLSHPTGQSKFLETATLESRVEVEQIIGAAVRRRFA